MGKGLEICERVAAEGRGAQYFPSRLERSLASLEALRQWRFPRRILVAGPFVGEFGNELRFQAFVRANARRYRERYVITYPGREVLYEDCRLVPHDLPLERAGYGYGRLAAREHRELAAALVPHLAPGSFDLFTTGVQRAWLWRWPIWHPLYRPFARPFAEEDRTDLLLHFRAIRKEGWDQRLNFEGDHADRLWAACEALGWRCGCVGHPRYSYCPPGCPDFRSEDIRQTVSKICATRLVVGQQSGGTHLGSYCGKPSVVWACGADRIESGLKRNPHRTTILVVADDTWHPPVERIIARIREALAGEPAPA